MILLINATMPDGQEPSAEVVLGLIEDALGDERILFDMIHSVTLGPSLWQLAEAEAEEKDQLKGFVLGRQRGKARGSGGDE